MTNYYLTIGFQKWGRGETLSESFLNARLHPGEDFYFYIIKAENASDVYVDNMGGVCYPTDSVIFKSDEQKFIDPVEWLD